MGRRFAPGAADALRRPWGAVLRTASGRIRFESRTRARARVSARPTVPPKPEAKADRPHAVRKTAPHVRAA